MSSRTTTGSILRDLGRPEDASENLVIRSQLMRAIQKAIKDRGMTQVRAAEILGTDQSRISNLMTGRVSLFSIDMLVNMAVRIGLRVDIQIGSAESARSSPYVVIASDPHDYALAPFVWETRRIAAVSGGGARHHASRLDSHPENRYEETRFYQDTLH